MITGCIRISAIFKSTRFCIEKVTNFHSAREGISKCSGRKFTILLSLFRWSCGPKCKADFGRFFYHFSGGVVRPGSKPGRRVPSSILGGRKSREIIKIQFCSKSRWICKIRARELDLSMTRICNHVNCQPRLMMAMPDMRAA